MFYTEKLSVSCLFASVLDNSVLGNTAAWVTGDLVVAMVDAVLLTVALLSDGIGVISLAVAGTHVSAIWAFANFLRPTKVLISKKSGKISF